MALKTQSVSNKDVSLEGIYQEDEQTAYNICTACMGYDNCTFPMNLSGLILHCAEFKPFPPRTVSSFPDSTPSILKASGKGAKFEYTGLCRNCELKEECTFEGVGKSVLNCDEYQ